MQLPNNLAFAVASVFATPVSVTAASNATEAVLTATNTFSAGDFVEYTGGWSKANGRVFRVKSPTGANFVLEGLDTSSVILFPAGAGTGSVRKVTTWVPIVGVLGCDVSGGEGKNVEVQLFDADMPVMLPDGFTATSAVMTIADDRSKAHHAALQAISDSVSLTCVRASFPQGDVLLYAGYCSFNPSPSLSKGNVMAVKASLALQNKPVRY